MAKIIIFLIKAYQYTLSPLFSGSCRFTPSCSSYSIEAIEKYGAVRGIYLSFKRISRCHPFASGGYDPVR